MRALRAGAPGLVAALSLFLLPHTVGAQLLPFPAIGDHVKCYKDPLKLTGTVDLLAPQFGLESGCRIGRAKLFCVPVKKRVIQVTPSTPTGVTGQALREDRLCYPVRCPTPVPPLPARDVVDQFGRRTVTSFKAFLLCTPALKEPIEHDVFPNTTATVTVQSPFCDEETVQLSGPTAVDVALGMLADTDGNGLEQVPTEMVQLDLTGTSECFGTVTVRLRDPNKPPFRRTLGEIEETVNTQSGRLDVPPFAPSGTAHSFFDVFFEVEVSNFPGVVLHNDTPKRMRGLITHKPPDPGNTYDNPDVIELYTENDSASGVFIGPSRHVPNPTTTTSTTTTTTPTTAPTCANGGIPCGNPCGGACGGTCFGSAAGTCEAVHCGTTVPVCSAAIAGFPCAVDANCPPGKVCVALMPGLCGTANNNGCAAPCPE